jgi:hypothetical protein
MSQLSVGEHQMVLQLGLDYQRGDDETKQVFIRDSLVRIFEPFLLHWRLCPQEVGIMPGNRNGDVMTPAGVWQRGKKILASGFSEAAAGIIYAFEDHPVTQHIAKHTIAATSTDEFGTYTLHTVKVAPGGWTHSNQFCYMVKSGAKCSDDDLPCIDGRINTDAILKDPKNIGLAKYNAEGMIYRVFPYWVLEAYPIWLSDCFQSASNQAMQVQEGTGRNIMYINPLLLFAPAVLREIASSAPTGSDPTGTYGPDPSQSHHT